MDSIEPEGLYDERGDVSWCRPLLQGDIFRDVVLPGFGDTPMRVQVVAHPCAMRKGPDLLERITVAPVVPFEKVTKWDGHLRVMPLPELDNGKHFATRFVDVTAVPAAALTPDRRMATLSNRGIYVLQQRLIMHYTRMEADLPALHKQSAPNLAEAELQLDWLETVLSPEEQTNPVAIDEEVKHFDSWLHSGEPDIQELLKDEYNFIDVRRAAQQAARQRRQDLLQGQGGGVGDEDDR